MHELAITKSLIESIRQESQKHGIKNPKKVFLELGKLSGFVKEPILMYFEHLKKDIPMLKKTELVVKELDGKIECNECHKECPVNESCLILCPVCDSKNVEIIQGRDIIIKNIEHSSRD